MSRNEKSNYVTKVKNSLTNSLSLFSDIFVLKSDFNMEFINVYMKRNFNITPIYCWYSQLNTFLLLIWFYEVLWIKSKTKWKNIFDLILLLNAFLWEQHFNYLFWSSLKKILPIYSFSCECHINFDERTGMLRMTQFTNAYI